MDIVTINGNPRTETGKKANKALRKEGQVPCVLYGGSEVVHFSAKQFDFKKLIYTPDFKLAELNIDGKVYKTLLKDAQFHPVTDNITHLDFIELVDNKKVIIEIPLKFVGVSPGVKEGGKLMELIRRIKVKTTADNIVDSLTVDISELLLGSSVRVKDIELPDGMEIMNSPNIPVGSVEVPRALRGPDEDEAEGAEGDAAAEGAEGDAAAEGAATE